MFITKPKMLMTIITLLHNCTRSETKPIILTKPKVLNKKPSLLQQIWLLNPLSCLVKISIVVFLGARHSQHSRS